MDNKKPTYYDRQTKTVKAVEPVRPEMTVESKYDFPHGWDIDEYKKDLAEYEKALTSLPAPIPIAPGTEGDFEQMPNPMFEGVHYEVMYYLSDVRSMYGEYKRITEHVYLDHRIPDHLKIKFAQPLPQQEKQEDLWREVEEQFKKEISGQRFYISKVITQLSQHYELKRRNV